MQEPPTSNSPVRNLRAAFTTLNQARARAQRPNGVGQWRSEERFTSSRPDRRHRARPAAMAAARGAAKRVSHQAAQPPSVHPSPCPARQPRTSGGCERLSEEPFTFGNPACSPASLPVPGSMAAASGGVSQKSSSHPSAKPPASLSGLSTVAAASGTAKSASHPANKPAFIVPGPGHVAAASGEARSGSYPAAQPAATVPGPGPAAVSTGEAKCSSAAV